MRVPLPGVGGRAWSARWCITIVPMPASVKISSRSTWAIRPSRMWARWTPLRTAWVQLATFGIMPPAIVPSATSSSSSSAVDLADQAGRVGDVAAEALDVGEVDQLLGADRLGDRAGDGVGVDVVGLAGLVAADRGDHRDELVVDQAVDHLGVDLGDVADEAELLVAGGRPDQPGVDAADADGEAAVHVDRCHELRVDLALEHHPGDVDRLGVGDAQAVDELGLLAEAFHQLGDLRAAAVHDDRPHADEAHQHDVLGEQRERIVVGGAGERVAAVLDDHGLAGEPPDVRQRLDEDRRLERRGGVVAGVAGCRSWCEADRGEPGGLVEAERDVGRLHRPARRALGEVVDGTHGDHGVGPFVVAGSRHGRRSSRAPTWWPAARRARRRTARRRRTSAARRRQQRRCTRRCRRRCRWRAGRGSSARGAG